MLFSECKSQYGLHLNIALLHTLRKMNDDMSVIQNEAFLNALVLNIVIPYILKTGSACGTKLVSAHRNFVGKMG